uniref:alpha/beta hydrolase n=1 Tax=Lactobacillus jensenii TaxID=109790 RepID=UPI00287033CB
HRISGMTAISYYLSRNLPFLKKQFKIDTYFAVAHSLGAPAIVATAMHYFKQKNFPTLKKAALIAGPFDGLTYLGDIPNVNYIGEKGRPIAMN